MGFAAALVPLTNGKLGQFTVGVCQEICIWGQLLKANGDYNSRFRRRSRAPSRADPP